ncbi:hypothetical protein MKX01_032760 [Papaver californicum]|nr:hypothetical protein MKX01_032760 [Papaver californicum]
MIRTKLLRICKSVFFSCCCIILSRCIWCKSVSEIAAIICCSPLYHGKARPVEYDHWHLMDNLVDFYSHPWAEIAFNTTIDNAALVYQINQEKSVDSEVTYKSQGMAHVLVLKNIWRKDCDCTLSPYMHSVRCTKVILHGHLLKVLMEQKEQVCENIMWHKGDTNRLVMFGLFEGPLVDYEEDEKECTLENKNVLEKEDLLEYEEEGGSRNKPRVFRPKVVEDSKVPEKISMDEEAREAPLRSLLDVVCLRTISLVFASFESVMKNTIIGHMEDLKSTVIGRMKDLESTVKVQMEDIRVQVVGMNKTMLDNAERLTAENKATVDKIVEMQTFIAWSKKKLVRALPEFNKNKGDFYDEGMQNPDNPFLILTMDELENKETVVKHYFDAKINDRRNTKDDINDLNRFIHLGIKYYESYNAEGTSILSCGECELQLCRLSRKVIDNALEILQGHSPSTKQFIEHMVRNIHVQQVKPAHVSRYRSDLAVQLFKKQCIEVNDTSG